MTLFASHRIERLIDILAERLTADHELLNAPLAAIPASSGAGQGKLFTKRKQLTTASVPQAAEESPPFEEEFFNERWMLLPSLVNKQYLMAELVKRLPGHALAGVQFLGWREALHRICSDYAHIPDRLEIELRLAKIFLNDLPAESKEALEPVMDWLKAGPSRIQTLVRSLAHPFTEALYYGSEMAEPWQQTLYEMVLSDGSWASPTQILQRASFPSTVSQVHSFCVDEMPSIGWDFIISKAPNLSIYLFSPCCMYWEDSMSDSERRYATKRLRERKVSASSLEAYEGYLRDTHPILANWGRLGRQTLHCLDVHALPLAEAYEEPEEPNTLLQMVQQDILFLRTKQETTFKRQNDSTIQIAAAGSSRLREVQILKDNVLHFLNRNACPLSEILVLAPDIRPYEPIIQFVFGMDLPIRIDPVAVFPQNPYLQAWQLLFDLMGRNWEVDAVLELFENRAFQAKHHLTSEDLHWFRTWLKEAKVRGYLAARAGCWADGIRRMILGLVYLLPEETPLPRIQNVDWGQAERLAGFIALIELLKRHLLAFQQKNRTLDEWISLLTCAGRELFTADDDDDHWRSFLCKLSNAAPFFPDAPFPFELIRSLFEQQCQSATMAFQAHFIEAIYFSSLQPGAVRPAQAIFLLGMDCESFPSKEFSSSLDWTYKKPFEEDRDRYLLLQALFSARKQFCISYCHLSAHDGKAVEAALPVQELMQMIDGYYPSPQPLLIVHPALPYDPVYFQKDGLLQSFSMQDYCAARALSAAPHIFWPSASQQLIPIPENKFRRFDLSELSLLARHPWKYFLQRRLKIFIKEEVLFSELRKDDLVLAPYQEQDLLKQSLFRPIDDVLVDYAHQFPAGVFGEWSKAQLKKKAAEWQSHLEKWQISPKDIFSACLAPQSQSQPIVLTIPEYELDVEITGEIDLLTSSGLLVAGETNLNGILRHWPAWLAARLNFPNAVSIYSLKKGICKTINDIDARSALQRFVLYALRAEESLSPLVFPWTELFLKKSFEEWQEEAHQSLMKEDEDAAIRWVLERSQPLPVETIWQEWNAFVKQTFQELIHEPV